MYKFSRITEVLFKRYLVSDLQDILIVPGVVYKEH